MLIRDLEYKTGLDRATICFYKIEGMIIPTRRENGYRVYTQENLSHFMKIKLLWQLGMSLDMIKSIQQGSADFDIALKKQIAILETMIEKASRAKDVCIQLREDRATYDTLDAECYLKRLTTREPEGLPWKFKEHVLFPFHPWRRYFARMFDYSWIMLLFSTISYVVFRIRPVSNILSS